MWIKLLRRFVVVLSLMFWQGGFTFYAAVVVPMGTEVLGSATAQGMLTRRVTPFLNLAGLAALLPLAWDIVMSADSSKRRRRLRATCWLALAITLAALFLLHPRLDALLDPEADRVLNRSAFRPLHRWYLMISTMQWGFGVASLALALFAWRNEDRQHATGAEA